jgi:hypothetical protein
MVYSETVIVSHSVFVMFHLEIVIVHLVFVILYSEIVIVRDLKSSYTNAFNPPKTIKRFKTYKTNNV